MNVNREKLNVKRPTPTVQFLYKNKAVGVILGVSLACLYSRLAL